MSNYRIVQTIGRGNFGVCHLCECIDTTNPLYVGKLFVVKQIPLSQLSASEKDGAVQEVKLLAELHHPFIVGYRESFLEGATGETLCIVMQYCEGGDLTTLIKNQEGKFFPEEQILDWFIQLCLALRYIHQRRIIHRDLKSQNIFLTKKRHVRLGDFGIARVLNGTNELAMSVVGTPYSLAPEVCENKPYSFSSDIWAAGCVLYELCTLKHAFDAHNLLGLVWKIVSESYPPIPAHYSPELHDLVAAMLAKDPAARPSIDAILEKGFIRARLHSQIKAKMSLKSKKDAAAAAGGGAGSARVPARPVSSTTPSSSSSSVLPQQQPSSGRTLSGAAPHSPSPHPLTSPTAAAASSAALAGTTAAMAGMSVQGGPNGTIRVSPPPPSSSPTAAAAQRPTLNLDERERHSPLGSPMPASQPSHGPRSLSAQTRGPPPQAGGAGSNGRERDYGAHPLLSPSELMQQRKKEQADQRAYELSAAARSGLTDRSYAQARTAAEFRGAGSVPARPTSSTTSQLPSYQHTFDEDAPPARQRSGSARDGSSSGRGYGASGGVASTPTPTRYGAPPFDWNASAAGAGGVGIHAYPPSPSPVPPVSSTSLDDRPIKSSGSYRLGGGGAAPIMSPQAQQAARLAAQQAGGGSISPGSATSSSGGYGEDAYGSGSHGRPSSVSSNSSSSRVTRVRDEDEPDYVSSRHPPPVARHQQQHQSGRGQSASSVRGAASTTAGGMDDSYSDEDFETYSDDDEEVLHAYTLSRSPSGATGSAASGGGYAASSPSAGRPLSSYVASSAVPAPPMGSKCDAIKAKALRSMSPQEFDEVCSYIRARTTQAASSSSSDGAPPGLSKEELAARFGSNNQEVVFLVEQYVYLSELLQNNSNASAANTARGNASDAASSSASAADSGLGSGGKTSRANLRSASSHKPSASTGSAASSSSNRTPVGTPTKPKPSSAVGSPASATATASGRASSAVPKPGTAAGARPGTVRR